MAVDNVDICTARLRISSAVHSTQARQTSNPRHTSLYPFPDGAVHKPLNSKWKLYSITVESPCDVVFALTQPLLVLAAVGRGL